MDKNILIAAGFDPSGGAGIVRDLHVMWEYGLNPASVITALTAQDDERFLTWEAVTPAMLKAQLQSVLRGGRCRWVKIGMVGTPDNLKTLLDAIEAFCEDAFILLDPVLKASTGPDLAQGDYVRAIQEKLDRISLITPNLPELERLAGQRVANRQQADSSARELIARGVKAVVIKGGHLLGPSVDRLISPENTREFFGDRLPGTIHGTGCAFSSALIASLALNNPGRVTFEDMADAVANAKAYVRSLFKALSGQ